MTRLAIVNRSPAYGASTPQESLDLVLAAGSFGQDISLYFVDDGVFQLIDGQQPEHIEAKHFSKTFKALEFYDIEKVFVGKQSLITRGLSPEDLIIDVEVFDEQTLSAQLSDHHHTLVF